MSYLPTKYDVITDLRRCVMASYTPKDFDDSNVKTFLEKAEKNLEKIKNELDGNVYQQVKLRIEKAKNRGSVLGKRREDLLTASCLIP